MKFVTIVIVACLVLALTEAAPKKEKKDKIKKVKQGKGKKEMKDGKEGMSKDMEIGCHRVCKISFLSPVKVLETDLCLIMPWT